MEEEQVDSQWFRYKCIKTGQILSLYNKATGEYRCSCLNKNKNILSNICKLLHSIGACEESGNLDDGLLTHVNKDGSHQKTKFTATETEQESIVPGIEGNESTTVEDINLVSADKIKQESFTEENASNVTSESFIEEKNPLNSEEASLEDSYLGEQKMHISESEMENSDENSKTSGDVTNNAFPTRRLTKKELQNRMKCSVCGKGFQFQSHLSSHFRSHSGEKPYHCAYCDRAFGQKNSMLRHCRKLHAAQTQFKCGFCEKKCRSKASYVSHLRRHIGEESFRCSYVRCNKSFEHKDELTSHLIFHADERPYECSECGMKFKMSHHLAVHLRRHTGVKPYKCCGCDKSFRHKRTLDTHLKSQTHGLGCVRKSEDHSYLNGST